MLSTRMQWPGNSVRKWMVWGIESGDWLLAARSASQVDRDRPREGSVARRDLDVREMRMRERLGWV